jgi:hypothetical protein
MKETTVSTSGNGIFSKAFSEIRHFGTYPFNMRILLLTNMLYAFVLPVVELFVGTYIMRNSSELAYVVGYQLAVYTGIPLTFLVNGFLMRRIRISHLYSFGMLLSGVSMAVMMSLETLDLAGIVVAGLIMGLFLGQPRFSRPEFHRRRQPQLLLRSGKFLQHRRRRRRARYDRGVPGRHGRPQLARGKYQPGL